MNGKGCLFISVIEALVFQLKRERSSEHLQDPGSVDSREWD